LLGQPIRPGQTILVFDEVQQCPRALESLRYFYEEMPSLHVAAAGSLPYFALENISFPVGRIQFLGSFSEQVGRKTSIGISRFFSL
ncbi:MAG: AAA family ATPase, partial [Lentisphaerota bacterium]